VSYRGRHAPLERRSAGPNARAHQRRTFALLAKALGIAATLSATASCSRAAAPADTRGRVPFLPTPSGTVGALLVAGPFDAPRPDIEAGPAPAEGGEWRLALAGPGESAVRLCLSSSERGRPASDSSGDRKAPDGMDERTAAASATREARPGSICYAAAEFAPGGQGAHVLALAATGRAKVWAGGALLGEVEAFERGRFTAPEGSMHVLVSLEVSDRAPALLLEVKRQSGGRRTAPAPVSLALADSREERLARLVERAFTLRLEPRLAREGGRVTAELLRTGACPALNGAFEADFACPGLRLGPGELERKGPDRPVSLAELALVPAGVAFAVPAGASARLEVEARLLRDGRTLARIGSSCLVAEGVERLADRIEREARSLRSGPPSALAYALLQAEKARLALSRPGGPPDPDALARDLEAAELALREASAGRDFQAGITGGFERAYYSDVDESAQPYLVYIPTGCKARTGPWPMVVYLHGYVPSYDKDDWLKPDPNFNSVMEEERCILAVPFGRSNTDFRNVGEDDVLRVIDEMSAAYPVDPRRIYLYGYSMGGLGAWTILCHYPDRFAAAVIVSGQSDHYLWHNIDRERFPPWWRHLIETDNPLDLAANIVHVPVRAYHGEADYVVRPEHAIRMVDRLRELGGRAELCLVKGASHWGLFDAVLWKNEPVAWLKEHRLPDSTPPQFAVRAGHPRYAAFGWRGQGFAARIDAMRDPLRFCELRYSEAGGEPSLAVSNAAVVRVRGPVAGLGALDGATYARSGPTAAGLVTFTESAFGTSALATGPQLSGPVKEVFRSPFCAVFGTIGSAEETTALRAKAERFVKEWRDFAKGRPPLLADSEVTPSLEKAKNLVLFGEPRTNGILARIAARLPVRWDGDTVEIASRSYSLAGRGLMFVYPNPDSPGRLVLVMSGILWGEHLSVNHKWDHVPDLVLFEAGKDTTDRMDPVNRAVVAGFFGPDWRLEAARVFGPGGGRP